MWVLPQGGGLLKAVFDIAALTFLDVASVDLHFHSQGDLSPIWHAALFWKECVPNHPILSGGRRDGNIQKLTNQLTIESIKQQGVGKSIWGTRIA